ncbi:MAG: beta strand repeat-containing protein, partial [Stellaceae bacterium]
VGIVGGSTLDVGDPVTFDSGGSISIRAGVLIVDASEIDADNDGLGTGGTLRLYGDSQITISGNTLVLAAARSTGPGGDIVLATGAGGGVTVDSSIVETGSLFLGRSGNVLVDTGQLSVLDGGALASLTLGPADSGSVAVTAGSIAVTDGGSIATVTLGPGNGGDVSLTASGAVTIDSALSPTFGSTAVFTAALGTGVGAAGNMTITAGSLNLVDGGLVGGASFYGTGQNGNVSVDVSGATMIDGGGRPTGILSTTIAGTAAVGNIVLHTGSLALSNGGQIAADTYGPGAAGNITVLVDQALTITGSSAGGALTGINSNAEYGSTGNAGTISVVAADLTLSADGVISSTALAGSAGNAGTIAVSAGSLSLTGLAQIISSTAGTGDAGTILVSAGTMSITDTGDINSSTYASGNGGDISVDVAGLLTIDGQGGGLSSGIGSQAAPGSTGNAGQVAVSAGALSVTNGGTISTTTFGAGDAGRVTVSADTLTLSSIGGIASSTQGAGNGGNVTVDVAGLLAIDGESGIFNSGIGSQALPGSTGNAGRVVVSAGALSLTNGGIISTTTFAPGNAGDIAVSVAGAVTMDGGSSLLGTGVFSNTVGINSGNAGQVAITAASLAMADGAVISTSTGGAGSGGAVTVDVAGALSVGNFAIITSNANPRSTGNAGRVSVTAGSLSLSGVGQIATTTFGAGNGGNVTVDVAGALTIDGRDRGVPSGILSSADPGSTGNAGQVAVSAGSLSVTNGGEISTSTFGPGDGGDVSVDVAGALALTGQDTVINSNANKGATGNAGTVAIAADSLSVQDGAQIATLTAGPGAGGNIGISVTGGIVLEGPGPQINAQSSGIGNAGSIVVSAADLQLLDGAVISTRAASANGGDITLHVGDLLYLLSSQIRTSVDGAKGNGGNITIDPEFVVLNDSQIIADAVGGNGGNITIEAGVYLASADSLVSATSQLGISGTINISGQNYELDKSLVPLPGTLRGAPTVSRDKCAAREGLDRSTLVDAGRGGLPQDPDAAIPALYLAGRGFAGAPLPAP